MSEASDDRYARLAAKLERDFPGINDPTSPRFYAARMSGNQMKQMIQLDRLRSKLKPPA